VRVDFRVNDQLVAWSDTQKGLVKGATVTLAANAGPDGDKFWPASVGTWPVRAVVDLGNLVPESSDMNNNFNATLTVEPPAGQPIGGHAWPLRLSGAGNYLEDQNGVPFQLVADAGWELTTQISDADAIAYLDDRLARGFNAVEIRVIGRAYQDNAPNNFYNEAPFTNGTSDWSVRNANYWARIDTILTAVRDRGMVALMFPAYLGFSCSNLNGWCQDMQAQTDAAMTSYGAWIADRYKTYGNIIWMSGGDCDASEFANALARNDAVVTGVRQSIPGALFGAEPKGGQIAGIDAYTTTGINFKCVYNYNGVQRAVQTAYNSGGPVMFQEGIYENEQGSSLLMQTSIAMLSFLGGALIGHVFGSCPMWNFGARADFCGSHTPPFNTWQNNLASPGSVAIGNMGKLMRSRKWWKLLPDYTNVVMINAKGTGDTAYHATARESSAGDTVMVWAPNTNQITIDMTKIGGSQAKAWWWNPTDNSASLINTFATTGTQNFTPPAGSRVLVIDNNALGLAAPGST
jgi:hypothetical protein